jgi:hypothetical protein
MIQTAKWVKQKESQLLVNYNKFYLLMWFRITNSVYKGSKSQTSTICDLNKLPFPPKTTHTSFRVAP